MAIDTIETDSMELTLTGSGSISSIESDRCELTFTSGGDEISFFMHAI